MKITIDTKEDSHEELRKVIKMLSSLVGEEVMSNQGDLFCGSGSESESSDMFSDDSGSDSGGSSDDSGGSVFNMFNSGPGSTSSEDTTEDTVEDKKEENEDVDIPNVKEYH